MFGYGTGYIGGVLALPSFNHYFGLDQLSETSRSTVGSFIVSLWLLGALLGVVCAIPVCSRLGRQRGLTLCAVAYTLGAMLQAVQINRSILLFNIGRLLNGVGVGVGTLVTPIYISEISTALPGQKGMLLAAWQVSIQWAALVGFWGAYISHRLFPDTSHWQWRVPVLFQIPLGVVLGFASLLVLPETPVWLGETAIKLKECREVLAWLRQEDPRSVTINLEIEYYSSAAADRERKATTNPGHPEIGVFHEVIGSPNLRKRLLCGVGLMTLMTLSGTNALNFYAPTIFASAGFTSTSASLLLTGIFGLVKLAASLAFMFCFVRVKGHRFGLILSTAVCSGALAVLAFCVRLSDQEPNTGIISCLAVFIFAFFFGIGHGPIAWNFCAEIFPPHLSARCCAITTCVQWVFQVVNAICTPLLLASAGWLTWVLFSAVNAITLVWCLLYIPETRDISIGPAMDAAFQGSLVRSPESVAYNEHSPLLGEAAA